MKTPTDILRDEHVMILRALDLVEVALEREREGRRIAESWWAELTRWLRAFADVNHHAKEERLLFPAMVRHGMTADPGGPIAVMLEEHVEGRRLVAAIESSAPEQRNGAARRYIVLLRNHIDKENGVLFPLADAILPDHDQRVLAADFDTATAELGRTASIATAEAALHELGAALPAAPPAALAR